MILEPLFEDTLLAFMSNKSLQRSSSLGWSHYYESWVQGGDKAYTLSSIMAMRQGMLDTREKVTSTCHRGRRVARTLSGSGGMGTSSSETVWALRSPALVAG